MIKNEKQYKITRKALQGWQSTHEQLLHYRKPGTAKWVHDAQIESAKIQIRQLQAQMKEYESLKAGKGKLKDISVVDDISNLLLKWRIRNNLTHRDLANLVDMKEQQIQRYEETNYQSASLSTITRVAHALQFYKHQGHKVAASR
jgi:ribosome-binding protein aMBF1 (putative translation factor)